MLSSCEAIYIGNTQQTCKKIMDGHFSDLPRLLKTSKNHINLLPISNITLIILCHSQIYASK